MGVVSLLGDLPVITAETIRNLRHPDGSAPCAEGVRRGVRWIGDRALPLDVALDEAQKRRSLREYIAWALAAMGFSGDGDGYGYGDGDGDGYGSGDGYGYGYGCGDGYGYGSGYGYGYGSGYGSGSGDGAGRATV